MAQQTAVEWLVRKLSTELVGEIPLHRWDEIRDAVQQAKQMEKEQMSKCFHPLRDRNYISDYHFECTICGHNNFNK